jgi:molybdate transport system ATP-binding protein
MIRVDFLLRRGTFDVAIHETFHAGITGVYGPSGSGKTSMLSAIAGLVTPEEGVITIGDKVVFNAAANCNVPVHRRHIGYVFQDGRLFPHMSVEKNLRYGIGKDRPQLLSFEEVVDILHLGHLLQKRPDAISGGEYQRTALGRALLSSPELLLLDEPFSAVDSALRSQIIPYLLVIQKKINIPMLVVSHELSDLLKLSNRLCIIREGACIGHDDYHRLLASEELSGILGGGTLLNSVVLNVEHIDREKGMAVAATGDGKSAVRILFGHGKREYRAGQEVRLFIDARDIALASQRLTGVTIQNQLEGTVVGIYDRNATTFCIVDTGFPLVVEITATARDVLDIREGSRVWCLFKSVAIDVAA